MLTLNADMQGKIQTSFISKRSSDTILTTGNFTVKERPLKIKLIKSVYLMESISTIFKFITYLCDMSSCTIRLVSRYLSNTARSF